MFAARNMMLTGRFSPLSLSPALWLDASVLGLADGAAVDSWTDMSGNGRNATASGTARPTYKTSALNGRAAIEFNGTTNVMDVSMNIFASTTPMSVWTVYKTVPGSVVNSLWTTPVEANKGYGFIDIIYQSQYQQFTFGAEMSGWVTGGFGGTTQSRGMYKIIAHHYAGSAPNSRASFGGSINGEAKTYVSTGGLGAASTLTNTKIGGAAAGSPVYATTIAEVIFFFTSLSTADRQGVEAYLNAKYAIY